MPPRKSETIEDKAYRVALSRLNRAAMSRSRLDAKLAAAGFDDVVRAAALDRLERAGLLSDDTYARALIEEFRATGVGPQLLRQKLAQRGVAAVLIDRLLSDHDAVDILEQATSFARKKHRTLLKLDAATQQRRLFAALVRRGYDADIVEQVVTQIVGDDLYEID